MSRVARDVAKRIPEDGRRLLERHSVLREISRRLLRIPFESERHWLLYLRAVGTATAPNSMFRLPAKRPPACLPNLAGGAVEIPENLSSSGDAMGRDGIHLEAKNHGAHLRLAIRQGTGKKYARCADPPRPAVVALTANICALLGSLRWDVRPLCSDAVALDPHAVLFACRRGLPNLWKLAGFGGRIRARWLSGTLGSRGE